MATHYFFKFHSKNAGFIPYVERLDSDEAVGTRIPLSIFYGDWRVKDYRQGPKELVDVNTGKRLSAGALRQVQEFFSIEGSTERVYFWIFLDDRTYCLEPVEHRVVDGPENLISDANPKITPKTIESKIVREYKNLSLPAVFANIRANQKYNRNTIVRLTDAEAEVAEHLVDHGLESRMRIPSRYDAYRYLSPLEFETLVFLIFVRNDTFASTWRGGTLQKYDMRVHLDKELHPFQQGWHDIQVKKKETKPARRSDGYWVIHTGKPYFARKLIGRDWIEERVSESAYLRSWLSESMAFFQVDW